MSGEKPGGHGDRAAAIAALELAVWDLRAKLADEPAWQTIARAFGREPQQAGAPVYAAGGYYGADADASALAEELRGYLDSGYRAVKVKIGGTSLAGDLARIEAALAVLDCPTRLAVDANARFDAGTAETWGLALDGYGLRWLEEMVDPLDYRGHARLAAGLQTPIATGENLFSRQDVVNLLEFGGMRAGRDLFQMDAGLSYGLGEYAAMLSEAEARGHDRSQMVPHGGHLINLHIVTALGLGGCEAYPRVFAPVGGFSPQCRMDDGRVRPGDAPGFGLEGKPELRPWIERVAP
ncbi:MAG: hypothetical protein KatS3mg118_0620 [Paracoccaceae bacterium]|nr:MAG: hypothetical protein KatS3mg118_0620 [Paracoccaceae bacterium]